MTGERGQATMLVLAILLGVLGGAVVLGGIARGLGVRADHQRAVDLAALAAARAMHDAYGGLFEPPTLAGRPNPAHLERDRYLALARQAATVTARRNGAQGAVLVVFPDDDAFAPVRVRATVAGSVGVGDEAVEVQAVAEAELAPPGGAPVPATPGAGEYRGPFVYRT